MVNFAYSLVIRKMSDKISLTRCFVKHKGIEQSRLSYWLKSGRDGFVLTTGGVKKHGDKSLTYAGERKYMYKPDNWIDTFFVKA